MLGLEGYGSDESDSEPTTILPQSVSSSSKKSTFSLPPPSGAVKNVEPSKVKSKRTVFTIARPSKTSSDDEDDGGERAAKKPRLNYRQGAGSSSLLAMLPPPSKAAAIPAPPPRVLGSAAQNGGGAGVIMPPLADSSADAEASTDFGVQRTDNTEAKSTSFHPPVLAKAKEKPQATHIDPKFGTPAVDFFSLATTSRPTPVPSSSTPNNTSEPSSSTSITSAPTIPVFDPPPPTPSDPYPGYYQLPSGQWAAYEHDFYKKHYESWYLSQTLNGNSQKGFEGAEGEGTVEIDAQEQLDLARKEREQKKSLTANAGGGPAAPNMNIKAPKIGSRARTRHQLSALLTEAFENREALEEKIAQGRRNRKEAGNKYGF